MKLILFVLFSFCICIYFTSAAQTPGKAKLFGYKEPVVSGRSPGNGLEENGKPAILPGQAESSFNYFLYLQSSSRVYPSEMWINGKPYAVSIETIKQTPVVRENEVTPSQPSKTELVPATDQMVLALFPVTVSENKLTAIGRSLAAGNELVVVYKQGGKFYYNTLKKLTVLEAAPLQ